MADTTFHLGLTSADIEGAELAIIPGDPKRVRRISDRLENSRLLARRREFTCHLGYLNDKALVICSTGIGGPSTSIAVEELAQLGIKTFLRIGTTGAIQPDIDVGDLIIVNAAIRLDGASAHFAPVEFPAVSSFRCTAALIEAARKYGHCHVGIAASSDTFYPGQERYDTVSGRVLRQLQGSFQEWQAMGVLNYEMETATLFTMCASSGLQAGCITGVIVNRTQREIPDTYTQNAVEDKAISAVVQTAGTLLT